MVCNACVHKIKYNIMHVSDIYRYRYIILCRWVNRKWCIIYVYDYRLYAQFEILSYSEI